MAKKPANKSKDKPPKAILDYSAIQNVYGDILDNIEKSHGLENIEFSPDKLSTGMLAIDLVIGGGLSPGMASISGPEASAKSTLAAHVLNEGIKAKIPVIQMRDPENSVDEKYTSKILHVKSLEQIFGKKDAKGNWIGPPPPARYYSNNILEQMFDSLVTTFNRLPDKLYNKDKKQWFFVFDKNDKRTSKLQEALEKVTSYDKQLYSKTGRYWYPAPDASPQALIIIDSYPSYNLEKTDEKEDSSEGVSAIARAYAQHLRRIVGKLRAKRIMIFGVNQLREKPMVMYGSPFYEPCGNALRYNSYLRNELHARAVPKEWQTKGSKITTEENIFGDTDSYAYKHFKNTKNKTFTPYLECWTRVWVKDSKGRGRGFDPAFDVYEFMNLIGIAKYLRGKVEITAPKELKCPAPSGLKWSEFKFMILNEMGEYKKLDKKPLKQLHDIKLRSWCKALLASGKAHELMFAIKPKKAKDLEE